MDIKNLKAVLYATGELQQFFPRQVVIDLVEEVDRLSPPQMNPQAWENLKNEMRGQPEDHRFWQAFLKWARVKIPTLMWPLWWECFLYGVTVAYRLQGQDEVDLTSKTLRERLKKEREKVATLEQEVVRLKEVKGFEVQTIRHEQRGGQAHHFVGMPLPHCCECGEPYPAEDLEAGEVLCQKCREKELARGRSNPSPGPG